MLILLHGGVYRAVQTLACIKSPGGLVITLLGPILRIFFVIQSVWSGGLRICISNKFPGNVNAVGPETTFSETRIKG